MDWAKSTARRDEKHLSFWICDLYFGFNGTFGNISTVNAHVLSRPRIMEFRTKHNCLAVCSVQNLNYRASGIDVINEHDLQISNT